MKRIIKAIDKELRRLSYCELDARLDGLHHEAERLRAKMAELLKLRNQVEGME